MIKTEIKKGVNLYTVQDKKFKSFRAVVLIHRPYLREEVTLNTLISAVIRMQSKNFPDAQKISEELENLYGGEMIARASKYGERQILKIGIETVSDKALGKDGNFDRAMNLLYDLAFLSGTGEGFSESIVELEKKNIKDAILAQKNDKRAYSVLRLQEEMCKDEPYGINPMGYIEDLEKITEEELYSHYRKILAESRIDIIFSGNFDEDKALSTAKRFAENLPKREGIDIKETRRDAPSEIKKVTDRLDVTQGKLCMGFRTKEGAGREKYPVYTVYNCIFGGSAVSKLFNNVREKLSLCYYVGSSIDRLKEIMVVRSGVEFDKFKTAEEEIMNQQSLMEKGEFTDEEIDFAKKYLVTAYESNLDSIGAMAEYYTMQILLGTNISIEEMTQRIEKVTREEITEAAKSMKLDTIYYMDKEAE
ncbi:MAG: insulinase family protein [Clostridia bacterium]|nr:insulinase family protein [Clostridia bacterium]